MRACSFVIAQGGIVNVVRYGHCSIKPVAGASMMKQARTFMTASYGHAIINQGLV